MGTDLEELRTYAFDPWVYAAAISVYLALRLMSRVVVAVDNPKLSLLWRRTLPIVPPLIAIPIALHGDIPIAVNRPAIVRVALGIWISYLAEKAHKILGQTILGDDAALERAVAVIKTKSSISPKPPENDQ